MKSLIKIELPEHQDVFLVSNYEPAGKWHIFLIDVNDYKAFCGHATDVELRSQAATINMIFSDFLSLTTNAFTKNDSEDNKFLYCLEKNCESFVFKWKSVDSEETIINIGSIKVRETDYGSGVSDVFIMLSKELFNLNAKVLSIEKDLENAKKEKEEAVNLVTEVTDLKDRVENELFSKFLILLNEKKRVIKELKQENAGQQNTGTSKKANVLRPVKVHPISDSSDEAERMQSDDSKSHTKRNSGMLFSDEEEPSLLPSTSKRRNRQQKVSPDNIPQEKSKRNLFKALDSESEDELLLNL